MADIEFSHGMGAYGRDSDAPHGDDAPPNSLTMMTNVAGAMVSLALIAGIGVWGYKLMVRDVSGIPVVRAAEGEMRVRPEDPGGQVARHQGLAVNAVAAEGAAAGPVDRVVLAPRAADLAQEDQPITLAKVAPVEQPQPLVPAAEALREAAEQAEAPARPLAENLHSGAIDAVVAELTADLPTSDAPDEELPGSSVVAEEVVIAPDTAAQAEEAAPRHTVKRPRLRPANGPTLITAAYVAETPTSEIDAADIPAGTRLAQLGAFDSPAVARSEWKRLEDRFGEYLQDKSRVVQMAQSGGRTFYRLRAMGFVDLSDARRFCSAFKAEGVDCIPVASK
ncbi:SPOR domain-containing protein [Roseobacter sp. YSTF-M11]|uniref:SPOR domain-containing protein n=1 Tax=Roseobacter insulae TaxID=2859783 RepID=A0A9X1K0C4_9RHOB|nr:SPOR domain-containing protein [Roseobacter insulae]